MGYITIWKKYKTNIIAMAAFVSWLWFFPLFGIVQTALEDGNGKMTFFNLVFLAATASGYVAFLYLRKRHSVQGMLVAVAPAAALAATWLVAILAWQLPAGNLTSWGYHALAMYALLPFIMGFSGAIYFASWGTTIYYIVPDERGRYMAAMVAAATFFYTVFVAVFYAAPLLALFLAGLGLFFPSLTTKKLASFMEDSQKAGVPPTITFVKTDTAGKKINPWKSFWFPFSLTIFCFYILAWETHAIVFSVIKEESIYLPILGQAIYALTFVLAAYYLDREKEIEKMALFGLIVLGCSFLLLPVALPAEILWPLYYLLEVSYGFIDLFMWVSLAYFCHLLSGNPKTYYARGLLLNILFIIFGITLMPLLTLHFEEEGYFILSITAGIILFMGMLPALSLRKLRLAGHAVDGLSDIIDREMEKLKAHPDLQAENFTRKEKEIITLLLADQKNTVIAEKLGISNNTLKTHIKNIYRKAQVKNRSELLFKFAGLQNNTKT